VTNTGRRPDAPGQPPAATRPADLDALRRERRARLLENGFAQFSERGFHATSIEQLCGAARVTPRHFYEEFESREALLAAVFDATAADLLEVIVSAVLGGEGTLGDRVAAALRAVLEHLLDDPRRARILLVETLGVSPAMERRRRDALHAIADFVEARASLLRAQGALPAGVDARLGTLALLGGTMELVLEAIQSPSPPPLDSLHATALLLWQGALTAAGVPLSAPVA
jgi:AcrR family transcriptional regulator